MKYLYLVQVIPNPVISSLTESTLETIFAYVYFTNIADSCNNSAAMPNQVEYTLRMQEYDFRLHLLFLSKYFRI